ncbi:MAG: SRPBCC family protein [Actinobacteria bacterium]|nr:SRPBCC family protein [Actinomycetota bacterium]
MELEHSFSVPVPVERAWDVLLDVERVAPCMPGATLDSVDGDEIKGRIRVKVGPIQMTYAGTARFTEQDRQAGLVVLEAAGKETRGAGTASAMVRSELTADGDSTTVTVRTTLNVTGKPAQFGRGVMTDVGGRLIGMFADNLASMLTAGSAAAAPAVNGSDASVPAAATVAESPAAAPTESAEATSDEALPIDVLNINTRAWSSLRRDGIQTLGDLTRRTGQQLLAIEGVGPASVTDIRARLADRGLALADSGHDRGAESELPAPAAPAEELAEVTPLRPALHEVPEPPAQRPAPEPVTEPPAWQPPDNEPLDLLDVAGLPVLKRALPAAVAVLAVVFVVFGLRRRRRARRR